MGYSGLIYAAIVAAWAAVLVPRWVRRNEEVDQARELDAAHRVRVLTRPSLDNEARVAASTPTRADSEAAPVRTSRDRVVASSDVGLAARRRRRVLGSLTLALAVTGAVTAAGRLPRWSLAVPLAVLLVFLALARRAAVAQARRRAAVRRPALRSPASTTAVTEEPAAKRVAVLDETEPLPEADPNAWEPVPVPLPTYVNKAIAAPRAVRRIDLSQPGAWTSGRLDPAGSIVLPPRHAEVEVPADLPEHRHAVGD